MMAILLDEFSLDANMRFPCHCPDCEERPYSLVSHILAFDVPPITQVLLDRGAILDTEDSGSVRERESIILRSSTRSS